ncbi:unnamed protein product [Victoria cruziana]
MTSFSVTRKNTPFQKHRDEEEAKKKRAEDETVRLYEEFVVDVGPARLGNSQVTGPSEALPKVGLSRRPSRARLSEVRPG